MKTLKQKKISGFPFKPTALFAALMVVGIPYAQAVTGPFATVPLHLQDNSESVTEGVKPNVLLQIDDSGSMKAYMNGSEDISDGGPTRIEVVKTALAKLLTNPEFKDAVNWNMITLCNTDGFWPNGYRDGDPAWQFGVAPGDLLQRVEKLTFKCATPSTERYLDSLHILRSTYDANNAYRCQKNYVVLFSDGDANGYRINMDGDSTTGFFPSADNDRHNNYHRLVSSYGPPMAPWWARGNRFTYLHRDPDKFTDYIPGVSQAVGQSKLGRDKEGKLIAVPISPRQVVGGRHASALLIKEGSGYRWNQAFVDFGYSNGRYPQSVWASDGRAIQYFAEYVYETDLKKGGLDAAGKSWDDPKVNGGKQTIGTFTIGFGSGLSNNGKVYLSRSATANGGQYLVANNQADLDNAFLKIFSQIKSENSTAAGSSFASTTPAINVNDADKKAVGAAAIFQNLQSGSSEIRIYDISSSGSLQNTYRTPNFANRRTLINVGNKVEWFNDRLSVGSNAYFNIPSASNNSNEWKTSLAPWLNRSAPDAAIAAINTNQLSYRIRGTNPDERNMGDVIGSDLITLGGQKYNRQQYMVTAANDGMVYLFESSSDSNHPYDLKLNYLPAGMERSSIHETVATNLKDIVDPQYGKVSDKPHVYLNDGGITYRTTDKSRPQLHFIAGNMGRGARGAYALALGGKLPESGKNAGLDAAQNDWDKSVPLFETQKGNDNVMGYTIGAPQIGRVSTDRTLAADNSSMTTNLYDVKYAVFVSSGTRNLSKLSGNDDNTEAALYIYNALDKENVGLPDPSGTQPRNAMSAGQLIKKISVPNAEQNRGGLMQPTVVDVNFDGVADVAYAADYSGGLYRFDLRGPLNSWAAKKIFQAKPGQKVTSAPAVFRRDQDKYIISFGTGSDLYQSDLSDGTQQSVYGIYDDLTVLSPTEKTTVNLLQQTMSTDGNKRSMTDTRLDPATYQGWYFDLQLPNQAGEASERVVVQPDMLLRTLVFSTRSYKRIEHAPTGGSISGDKCEPTVKRTESAGSGWIMQVKVDNGGDIAKTEGTPEGVNQREYAYLDFEGTNKTKDVGDKDVKKYTGFSYNAGLPNYALLLGSSNDSLTGSQSSTTIFGAHRSGEDDVLRAGGKPAPSICFSGVNNTAYIGGTKGTQGVHSVVKAYGKICQAGLRRISWRDIF